MINNTDTNHFIRNNQSIIKRSDIINYIIEKYSYKNYLEIGVFDAFTFKNIQCELKHGVDPGAEGYVSEMVTHKMTSDTFFENTDKIYDIIFIDGLHHYRQVVADINNALKHISDNGYIILHDCNPGDELSQKVPRESIAWNGDVWKAWILWRKTNPNNGCFVFDTDFGIGIIKYSQNLKPITSLDIGINYRDFEQNKNKLLNLKKCENYTDLDIL